MVEICPKCDGKGFVIVKKRVPRFERVECDECHGSGIIPSWLLVVRANLENHGIALSVKQKA